jgi:hypothetical protein
MGYQKLLLAVAWVAGAALPAAEQGGQGPLLLLLEDGSGKVSGTRLRETVAAELGRDVLGPDDERASSATQSLLVQVTPENEAHAVYLDRASQRSLRRTVRLPQEEKDVLNVLGLLAGNLARNEALELVPEGLEERSARTGDKSADQPLRGPVEAARQWALHFGLGAAAERSQASFEFELGASRRWSDFSLGPEFQFAYFPWHVLGPEEQPYSRTAWTLVGRLHRKLDILSLEGGVGMGVLYFDELQTFPSFGTFHATHFAFLFRVTGALVFQLEGVDLFLRTEAALSNRGFDYLHAGGTAGLRFWL